MKSAYDTAAMLRQQVNAKVIWGAGDREVLDWLEERHGINGTAATALLADAYQAKRTAVRKKALLYLAFSVPGMLLPLSFFFVQGIGGFVFIGYAPIFTFVFGFISLGVFIRSLFRLLTGHTQGSVD